MFELNKNWRKFFLKSVFHNIIIFIENKNKQKI
jgi:hypothetical protein